MTPNSSFHMFVKLFSQCKALLHPEHKEESKENENDAKSKNELQPSRDNVSWLLKKSMKRGGAFLSLLAFVIVWWKRQNKKGKRSLLQHRIYRALRIGNGSGSGKQNDYRNAIETPLSVLLVAAKKGIIIKALINSDAISYKLDEKLPDKSKWRKTALPKGNPGLMKEVMDDITDGGCLDISVLPETLLSRLGTVFVTAFPFIYLFLLYHMMKRLQKGQHGSEDVGTDYEKDEPERTTFSDVAGVDTAQIELQEVVSYLSDPKPFLNVGAAPPRGLLLHGKPGLGKTLLARAVAGEAQADHFVSCSGSDFVEIYVGQGAKRVRNLFADARKQAIRKWRKKNKKGVSFFNRIFTQSLDIPPKDDNGHNYTRPPTAVIFFDEVDSIAKCRDGIGHGLMHGGNGGNDEREQTLNALLAELDGFNKSNVLTIIIAATNRISILDPAILRPGRFDRHVAISLPRAAGREAILKIHARNKNLDEDVDLSELANDKCTSNFTGAELKNVMNEAALLAVREGYTTICQHHLHHSIEKIRVMKSYCVN